MLIAPISALRPDAVTVVCCGDDSFIAPAGVMLASLLEYASDDRFYDLIFLHSGGPAEKLAALEAMARPNAAVRCFDISGSFDFSGLHTENRKDISPMTFARLLIPELLSESYSKALYLDADMLLFRDVAALFDLDLQGKSLAAAKDPGFPLRWNEEIKTYSTRFLGITDPGAYYSAGVLVLDLHALRREFSPGALLGLARSRNWIWHDQDVLNFALRGKIATLDPRWNAIYPDEGLPMDARGPVEDPWIFHFAGMKQKPWQNLNSPYADAFWRTAGKTPFYLELTDRLGSFQPTYDRLYGPPSGKLRSLLRRILPPPVASVQRDVKNLLNALDGQTRLLLTLLGRLQQEESCENCPPMQDTPLPISPISPDAVTLVCCGDDRFVPTTAVLLRSVADRGDPNRNYDLLYLHNGLSDAARRRLAAMEFAPNISLRLLDIRSFFEEAGLFTENRANFSPMAYARLLIPEILTEYPKVLYLDGDMVASDDIGKLFDLPLNGCLLGACTDLYSCGEKNPERRRYISRELGIEKKEDYIISGMLLMDLHGLRREFAPGALSALARSRPWRWHDQDVLNFALRGRVALLPGRWNLCHVDSILKNLPPHLQSRYVDALNDPGIFHFAGAGEKPWLRAFPPLAEHFWESARKTPFYHLLLRQLKMNLATYERYNPQKGGETPMLKRFLKKILPPPVNSVQRDLKYVLDAIDEQKKLGLVLLQQLEQRETAAEKVPNLRLKFEFSLADHCNLNCAGCSHFSPVAEPAFPDLEEARRDFQRLSDLFDGRCEFIHLMGGEPLLNEQREEFLSMARENFPAGDIYLITNGLLLPKMPDSFYETCAKNRIIISVTHYPVAADYDSVKARCERFGVDFAFFRGDGPQTHFNRLALDTDGRQDPAKNYVNCPHSNNCLYLRGGKMYPCGIGANMALFEAHFAAGLPLTEGDGVDIYRVETGRELLNRLAEPSPRCRICRMDKWPEQRPWGHSKKERSEWT